MSMAVLIDPANHQVCSLRLSNPTSTAELARVLGSDDVTLGARLPDGGKIYLDPLALYTSKNFFHHCLAITPLPGRGIIVGNQDLSTLRVGLVIDFMSRDEAFARMQPQSRRKPCPHEAWLEDVAAGGAGICIACDGSVCRYKH